MSYDIVKSISKNQKDGRIFITSASNNCYPRGYSKWEFMANNIYSEEKIKNRELYLFHNIIGGSLQLSNSVNENWKYAENRFYEYCRNNNINTSDICELPYKNNGNIELLKPYYEIFNQYLEEKKEGKYYLNSSLGYILKVNKNKIQYTPSSINIDKYCKNFKKVYNDYCKINKENREHFNIKIEEFTLDNNLDDSIKSVKDNMELAI